MAQIDSCEQKETGINRDVRTNSTGESSHLLDGAVKEVNEEKGAKNVTVVPVPTRGRMIAIMAVCMFLHISSFGMIIALGVIYVELINYFETTRGDAALVQSLFMGFCLGGAVITTKLVTKFDSGLVIGIASLVTAVSFCTSAFAPNIQVVIVLMGTVAGLAVSIHVLGAFVIVSWTFKDNRKFALAILTLGSTIGQIIMPYITTALIDAYLWQGAVIILGAGFYLNCIPCSTLIHYSKHYFYKGDDKKLNTEKWISISCLTDVPYMFFLSTCFAFDITGPVEQWFVADMSVLKGFTVDAGTTLLSLMGIFGFVGRIIGLVVLRVRKSTKPELHLAYLFFVFAVGHVVVTQSQVYWGMVVGIIIRGLSVGQIATFFAALQAEIRGPEVYPQTVSTCNLLFGVGAILGGFLGGLTFDITGSYSLIFYIGAGVNVYITLAMILIYVGLRRKSKCKEYEPF